MRTFALFIVGFAVSVYAGYFTVNAQQAAKEPVCPEDFTNSADKIAAFERWIYDDFKPKNQETFFADLREQREKFYRENGCKIL